MRPSPWPVLLPPSCPCLPGRPLCPAAAGLRLLSSPSSLFVLWLSLPASLPVCVLVCCLLPLLWPLGGWFVPEFVCYSHEIRHQPKRTKTNAWKVSIGHGHRWHSQSRSHHAVVNHEWLYARHFPDGDRRRSAAPELTERLPQSAFFGLSP